MSSKPVLRIDWATHEAARYACEKWHYSRRIPANKSNYFGVWEDGAFCGVIIFGLGASPSLGKPYGLGIFETCELTRVALSSHKCEVTRMISICLRLLRSKNQGLRLCVSFADTFHDHHGGIYQGGGWIYSGLSAPSKIFRLPSGELADPRRYNGHGHNKIKRVPTGAQLIDTPGKHRYLMPLDDAMRAKIAPLAKPYPKSTRAKKQDSESPSELGGAVPTGALHTSGAPCP